MGWAIIFSLIRSFASLYLPAKINRRASGKALKASRLLGSYGPPAYSVSSFIWSLSFVTPPKTIAPRRPLPTGRASVQCVAGFSYQSTRGCEGALASSGSFVQLDFAGKANGIATPATAVRLRNLLREILRFI